MVWIRNTLELFTFQTQIKLQRLMQYRVDFIFGVLMSFGFSAIAPLFQYLVYTHTRGYPGWDLNQILLFQGILLLGNGIREAFFGEVRGQIDALMARGEFDRLLLKPFPPLLSLLTNGFSPYALGTLIVGGVLVAVTWARSGAALTIPAFILFLVFLAVGVALYLAVTVLYCALTVRWVYTLRLSDMMNNILQFSNFPQELYPLVVQTIFITVLPLSIATHWPAQALLGRIEEGAWIAIGAVIAIWVAVIWFWEKQLKRYASAGG